MNESIKKIEKKALSFLRNGINNYARQALKKLKLPKKTTILNKMEG